MKTSWLIGQSDIIGLKRCIQSEFEQSTTFCVLLSGGNDSPYYFSCNGEFSCSNTKVDEEHCSEEQFVCSKGFKEEHVRMNHWTFILKFCRPMSSIDKGKKSTRVWERCKLKIHVGSKIDRKEIDSACAQFTKIMYAWMRIYEHLDDLVRLQVVDVCFYCREFEDAT